MAEPGMGRDNDHNGGGSQDGLGGNRDGTRNQGGPDQDIGWNVNNKDFNRQTKKSTDVYGKRGWGGGKYEGQFQPIATREAEAQRREENKRLANRNSNANLDIFDGLRNYNLLDDLEEKEYGFGNLVVSGVETILNRLSFGLFDPEIDGKSLIGENRKKGLYFGLGGGMLPQLSLTEDGFGFYKGAVGDFLDENTNQSVANSNDTYDGTSSWSLRSLSLLQNKRGDVREVLASTQSKFPENVQSSIVTDEEDELRGGFTSLGGASLRRPKYGWSTSYI
jgi:hypothetical protein